MSISKTMYFIYFKGLLLHEFNDFYHHLKTPCGYL
jgi:hypothetical protein